MFSELKALGSSTCPYIIANRTNGKPLAAIGKSLSAIGRLMIGKTWATNGEEVTSAMIGNDELKLQLQIILLIIVGNLEQIRNDW